MKFIWFTREHIDLNCRDPTQWFNNIYTPFRYIGYVKNIHLGKYLVAAKITSINIWPNNQTSVFRWGKNSRSDWERVFKVKLNLTQWANIIFKVGAFTGRSNKQVFMIKLNLHTLFPNYYYEKSNAEYKTKQKNYMLLKVKF